MIIEIMLELAKIKKDGNGCQHQFQYCENKIINHDNDEIMTGSSDIEFDDNECRYDLET